MSSTALQVIHGEGHGRIDVEVGWQLRMGNADVRGGRLARVPDDDAMCEDGERLLLLLWPLLLRLQPLLLLRAALWKLRRLLLLTLGPPGTQQRAQGT